MPLVVRLPDHRELQDSGIPAIFRRMADIRGQAWPAEIACSINLSLPTFRTWLKIAILQKRLSSCLLMEVDSLPCLTR